MNLLHVKTTMPQMKENLGLLQATARSRFRIGPTNGFCKQSMQVVRIKSRKRGTRIVPNKHVWTSKGLMGISHHHHGGNRRYAASFSSLPLDRGERGVFRALVELKKAAVSEKEKMISKSFAENGSPRGMYIRGPTIAILPLL